MRQVISASGNRQEGRPSASWTRTRKARDRDCGDQRETSSGIRPCCEGLQAI
jgi:hypothetical protein